MYKLYHANGACSVAIQAALTLTDAEFEVITLDLGIGEHLKPHYLAINPFGKVPALDTGDFVLTEGMAIHMYLADTYPKSNLFPQNSPAKYHAYKWLSVIYSNVHPHFGRLFSPDRFGDNADDIQKKAVTALFDLFKHVDDQLKIQSYLAGDEPTAADLYLAVQLHWAKSLQLNLETEYKTLDPFLDRIHGHKTIGEIYTSAFKK